jgi:hypothetical protein
MKPLPTVKHIAWTGPAWERPDAWPASFMDRIGEH